MGYQPYLIAPYKTGLELDIEPWLSPQDAFISIVNGHIHHGVLEKRKGYQLLGYFTETPTETITNITQADPAVVTAAGHAFNDGDYIVIYGVVDMTQVNGGLFVVANAGVNDFELTDINGNNIDSTNYTAYGGGGSASLHAPLGIQDRIMGIFRRIADDGTKELIIFNRTRAATFNTVNEVFVPLDSADIFTSTDDDFIWADNYNFSGSVQNRLYFTNGRRGGGGTDGLQFWDGGTTTTRFVPTFNTVNTLEGAKILFAIKNRLLLLSTLENGSDFPQRARWCQPQADPTAANVWDDATPGRGGFVDAATGDQIISARRIQNQLIVFFTNSVWTLRPNSNPALPFVWEKINDYRATQGRFATLGYDRYVSAIGVRGITATDGVETRRIDERIEEFVTDLVNADLFNRIYAARSYGQRRSWYLYSDGETDEVNNALIYDDESAAWSIYDIALNVLGYGNVTTDLLLSDFDLPDRDWSLDSDEVKSSRINDFFWSGEEDIFLGGDRQGRIFKLEESSVDYTEPISFEMTSASWNFTKDQGTESQFGYIDLYLDAEKSSRIKIDFYKDQEEDPYTFQIIDCLPDMRFISDVVDITLPQSTNISAITQADPAVVTVGSTINFNNGDQILIKGVTGMTEVNDQFFLVSNKTNTTFEIQFLDGTDVDSTSYGAYAGSGTVNTLLQIDSPNHGLTSSDSIWIYQVLGTEEINDQLIKPIFYANDDTKNSFRASELDATDYTAYERGGKIFYHRFQRTKVWKRAFAKGIGFQHKIQITHLTKKEPLRIHGFRAWARPVGVRQLR